MKKLARLLAAGASLATVVMLTAGTGLAAADSLPNMGWSYGSNGSGFGSSRFMSQFTNNNQINLSNYNSQTAITGKATTQGNNGNNNGGDHNNTCDHKHNRDKRHHKHHRNMMGMNYGTPSYGQHGNSNGQGSTSAQTGNATNNNSTEANVAITNETPVTNTSNSSNRNSRPVVETTNVTNNNTVTINNYNQQFAQTGDASAMGSTDNGSSMAQTGNATNNNSTDFEISILNGVAN